MRGSEACVQRRFGRRRAAIFVAIVGRPAPARTCEPGPRMCRSHGRDARLAPPAARGSPLHPRPGVLPPRRARRPGLGAPSGHRSGPARDVRTDAAGRAARVWYPSGSPRSRRSSLSDDRRGGPRSPGVPTPSGPVAQLAEQQTLNLLVEGSTPSRLTNISPFASIAYSDGPARPQSNRHPRLLVEGSTSSRLTTSSSSPSSGSTDSADPPSAAARADVGIVWEKVETRVRAGSTHARGIAAATAGRVTLVLDLLRAVTGPRGEDDLVSDRSWDRVGSVARRRAHEPHRARPTNADRARGQRSDDDEATAAPAPSCISV